jgi:hypothetical protein
MLDKITVKDIEMRARHIETVARELGLIEPGDIVVLEKGSETYGINWKLWVKRADSNHFDDVLNLGHIGVSRRGAYNVLAGYSRALQVVARNRQDIARAALKVGA